MINFLNPRQAVAGAGTGLVALVTVAAEKSPNELLKSLEPYTLLFCGIMILAAYFIGLEEGKKVRPVQAPATVKTLMQEVHKLEHIMLDKGNCKAGAAKASIKILERDHFAWHDKASFKARTKFLGAVRSALEARSTNGYPMLRIVGDYTDKDRASFAGRITYHAKDLGEKLSAQNTAAPPRRSLQIDKSAAL